MKNFKNIIDLVNFFNSEEKCHQFLKFILWSNGKKCPCCGSDKITEFKTNFKRNRCQKCEVDFSLRKGTIFDDSKITLQKWFMAIYLIGSNKKGISSVALAEQIGITQKSAWFILHRIRNASNTNFFQEPLKNEVEIDEAYFGGKAENMHMSKRIKAKGVYKKTAVLGMIERNNKVKKEIYNNIEEGSILMTYEHKAYQSISNSYNHKIVNHSAGEYVKEGFTNKRGKKRKAFKIHTNTIEGFWSHLKRCIFGVYHWASNKHMQKYLNDYSFKYNTKDLQNNERFTMFLQNVMSNKLMSNKLIYKDLISC